MITFEMFRSSLHHFSENLFIVLSNYVTGNFAVCTLNLLQVSLNYVRAHALFMYIYIALLALLFASG